MRGNDQARRGKAALSSRWLQPTLRPTLAGILATRDPLLDGVVLSDATVDDLTEFMRALTDPAARDLTWVIPTSVPSGLPIDR